jgi:hypothetical protein
MHARNRRLLVFGLLATGMGVGGWLLWPRPSAVTPENAAKIQLGMTRTQVEAILGGQADETLQQAETDDEATIEHWNGPTASMLVGFDAQGIVCYKAFGVHESPTIWEQIRRLWGLPSRRKMTDQAE